METPLSAVQSIHDMLLQSWGGVIRVFPAAPDAWTNAAFANLRADGAFLVSAGRRDGRTSFVTITSLAGEPCRVKTDLAGLKADVAFQDAGDGIIILDLKRGQTARLRGAGEPEAVIQPVAAPSPPYHFGLPAGGD